MSASLLPRLLGDVFSRYDSELRGEGYRSKAVHDLLDVLQEQHSVGVLPACQPVIMVELCQAIQLLQGEGRANPPQVGTDVHALQAGCTQHGSPVLKFRSHNMAIVCNLILEAIQA